MHTTATNLFRNKVFLIELKIIVNINNTIVAKQLLIYSITTLFWIVWFQSSNSVFNENHIKNIVLFDVFEAAPQNERQPIILQTSLFCRYKG